jgi:hypothetical protein
MSSSAWEVVVVEPSRQPAMCSMKSEVKGGVQCGVQTVIAGLAWHERDTGVALLL